VTAAATDAPGRSADPRPVVVEYGGRHLLAGARCVACGHALARVVPRCSRCRGPVQPERFGPDGVIWATTVVHIPAAPGDQTPYTLAYVDLDAGPRVLLRLETGGARATIGDRVSLTAPTASGSAAGELVR
jgi:uncharacterized OB-fold protein